MSVLPACAGVIPAQTAGQSLARRITRMRGGDPASLRVQFYLWKYYPHARG